MGPIWFACCPLGGYREVLREVRARDREARLLRFGSAGDMARLAAGFPEGAAGAVAYLDAGSRQDIAAAEAAITRLSAEGRCRERVVLLGRAAPEVAARLFAAGATEVIAMGGAACPEACRSCEKPCAEGALPTSFEAGARVGQRDDLSASVGYREASPLASDAADRYEARCGAWDGPPAEAYEGFAETAAGDDAARTGSLGRVLEGGARPREVSAVAASAGAVCAAAAESPRPHAENRPAWGGVLEAAGAGEDAPTGHRAPLVVAISGRGGVGKTTLVACMAAAAARMGLRAAVLDLDLMFGNLHSLYAVDAPRDLARIVADDGLRDEDVEGSAMRVGPGLTLWGPVADAERAELLGLPCEQLVGALRGLADVIIADTSVFWGDAVAAVVARCDRCLVVGGAGPDAGASATRAVDLACRVGVPRTKMTSVVTRFGAPGCGEEAALRFELAVSLHSRARIADGGQEVAGMLAFGKARELAAGQGAFARDIRSFTASTLRELGCAVAPVDDGDVERAEGRPRLRLPWKRHGEVAP